MPQGRPKTDDHTKMMINFTEKTAYEALKDKSDEELESPSLTRLELLLMKYL